MIEQIQKTLTRRYPVEIIEPLLNAYLAIRSNYALGKYEPSELNGGKFVEACCRLLEYELTGSYTPIGTPIRDMARKLRGFEQLPAASAHDSYRLHMPRILLSMYNIRNRRGVGHVSNDVNPNWADASFIVAAANWIMAELIRLHHGVDVKSAERIIQQLVERKTVLVYEIFGTKRVLLQRLPVRDQILLLLYEEHPEPLSEAALLEYTQYKNTSRFRKILQDLARSKKVFCQASYSLCAILPPGIDYVEQHIPLWQDLLSDKEKAK